MSNLEEITLSSLKNFAQLLVVSKLNVPNARVSVFAKMIAFDWLWEDS